MLTSPANQKVKDLVKLRNASFRRKTKLFIIEGCREIFLALEAKVAIKEIYFCKDLLKDSDQDNLVKVIDSKEINLSEVSPKVYEKMAYGNRREGIIAVARRPEYKLKDIQLSSNPLLVVAEAVEKPGNLGAILRTVDAAGCDGLVVADSSSDIYNHNVVRSSVGAVFSHPVIAASSPEIAAWLKNNNINIICADPSGNSDYSSIDFRRPTAIILGSEEKGLSRFWKDKADSLVSAPMKGKADSLNVSVAAAVFIFEALRQRANKS